MADEEYNRKLESSQQHIPFLNNRIVRFKGTRKKNKKQQLAEMVSPMITDKNKNDQKMSIFQRLGKPVPPSTHQIQAIPTHVSNILANPNAAALINSVVNQFKGRQTPLLSRVPSPYLRQPTPSPNQQNYQNFVPNEMFGSRNPPALLQVATNFWDNQDPQPQNYPSQRSFTTLPNQFDNQMQQMDYYPPGSAPTHNTYNHQPPPLLSSQYDNYETHQRKNEENLFGNKDRDMRCRDDWRRPSTSQRPRDSYRDPRLHRDPWGYRDDPRAAPTRDSREYERDSRSNFRDSRPNRYPFEREPSRPSSRSNSRGSVDNNSFVSPLDSLYSKEVLEAEPEVKEAVPEVKPKEAVPEVKPKEAVPEVKQKEEEVNVAAEPKAKASPSTEIKEKREIEENVASTSASSSTECDSKLTNESQAEVTEVGDISCTNDIPENQTRDEPKLDNPSQADIINKFLKKLLENERTRAAASLFIDNVSNSLDDDNLKMVVQTVKSASLENQKSEKRSVLKKKKLVKRRLGAKLTMTKKAVKRKLRLRRQRNEVKEDQKEEEEEVEEGKVKGEVVVTVGERSRRRVAASPKRKKVKHKTELVSLHQDIQDMFIGDGVLTATGNRMCRLLKSDDTKPVLPETRPKRTRSSAENFDSKVNSDKLKVMSNVRVPINRIPVDKLIEMDDESQRYFLRRSNKSTESYAELDSEDEELKEREKEKEKEKELGKKESSGEESEKEKEEKEKLAETPKKGRKRGKTWTSRVIPKRKKKVVEEKEENEDKSPELVEPDKNYYRNKHPASEVLSSRLSPEKADIAIKVLNVSLSSIDDDLVRKELNKPVQKESPEEKEEEKPKPKKKKPNEEPPPIEKPKETPPLIEKPKETPPPPIKKPKETSPPMVKKEKDIDMTVFIFNTDMQEKNEQIEQERLRKMTELNKTVKTNRNSLNFVDQLSNRLSQQEKQLVVTVKSVPVEPKKPTKVMERPVAPVEVVQKGIINIQERIQKLQGILKERKSVEAPPPLKSVEAPPPLKSVEGPLPLGHLVDKPVKDRRNLVNTLFLTVRKHLDGLEYTCHVPSCFFVTTNRDIFFVHWKEDHTRINQSDKATKCPICGLEVTATLDATLLTTFFTHVENEHLNKPRSSFDAGFIYIDREGDINEYFCGVAACSFRTKARDMFLLHLNEDHAKISDYRTTKCGICQNSLKKTHDSNLLNTLFAHIENEHLEANTSPANILKPRRLCADTLSATKIYEKPEEEKEEDENSFPFKTSGVISLTEDPVPPLSPVREKPSPKIDNVVLKENRKSFGFIGDQLYRCALCNISFSKAKDFKAHTTHSKQCRDMDTIKPYKCAHCKRMFKNASVLLKHVQSHGQLRFGCSLCIKKFPSQFSLKLHMRSKHNVTNIVTTPLIPNKTNVERDEFILSPVSTRESENPKESTKIKSYPGQKTVYGPDEIDQLPKRYIFNSDARCAVCSFTTKVRYNLIRHLQFHSDGKSVPDIAPVNPVPCVDKNEKMFDKMTNLAINAFTGDNTSRMGEVKPQLKAVKEEQNLHPSLHLSLSTKVGKSPT